LSIIFKIKDCMTINKNIYKNSLYLSMKLRLETGSVKLRLLREEMARLDSDKSIAEKIQIDANNTFTYIVSIVTIGDSCLMEFSDATLHVSIPSNKATKWLQSNQVGIRETIVTENKENILLVIEEDLPPRQKNNK